MAALAPSTPARASSSSHPAFATPSTPRPSSVSLSTPRPSRSTSTPMAAYQASSPSSSASRLFFIVVVSSALRLALFSTSLPDVLQSRIELSTPVSSFKAFKETLHLSSLHDAAPHSNPLPYSSSGASISPLLLLLQPILSPSTSSSLERAAIGRRPGQPEGAPVFPSLSELSSSLGISDPSSALLWTLFDVLAALALLSCSRSRRSQSSASPSSGKGAASSFLSSTSISEARLIALYLLNPVVIASCLARDLSSLNAALVLWSTALALEGSIISLSLLMAISSLVSLYPLLLVPALVLLSYQSTSRRLAARYARQRRMRSGGSRPSKPWASLRILAALVALGGGAGASYVLAGNDWRFLDRVYGTIILLPNLQPNLGLWWYFFISMFDHFRSFFLLAFNLHPLLYVLPFLLRYGIAGDDALFAVTAMCGVFAVFKSYPTLGDCALWWTMLVGLHGVILPYLRYPLITLLLHLYALVLGPALHHLWLVAGSANANFFYAITLVWGLAGGSLLLDAMWAWGRGRWEAERPRLAVEEGGKEDKGGVGRRTRIVIQS